MATNAEMLRRSIGMIPTAERDAIKDPSFLLDPINYVTGMAGITKGLVGNMANLGKSIASDVAKSAPVPGAAWWGNPANIATQVVENVAPKVAGITPKNVPGVSELKDIAQAAKWVGGKLGIGGEATGKRVGGMLESAGQKPLTTVAASAFAPGMKVGGGASPVTPINQNISTSPVMDEATATRAEVAGTPRHPAEGTADVWDFAEKSSPEQFKRFIDRNQDHPGIKGLGYIETKDPKTGKMRIEKVISRPEEGGGGSMGIGGGKDLNIAQLRALAPYYRKGDENNIDAQRLAFDKEKFAKENDKSDPVNFMKAVMAFSPKKMVKTIEGDQEVEREVIDTEEGKRIALEMGYIPPKEQKPKAVDWNKEFSVLKSKMGNPQNIPIIAQRLMQSGYTKKQLTTDPYFKGWSEPLLPYFK